MKKTYINPVAELLSVGSQAMLATSIPFKEDGVTDAFSEELDPFEDDEDWELE